MAPSPVSELSPEEAARQPLLTPEDHALLVKHFEPNAPANAPDGKGGKDGKAGRLSPEAMKRIVDMAASHQLHDLDPLVAEVIRKLDLHSADKPHEHKLQHLQHQVSLTETQLRYAAYSMAMARAFRYLAFTSDFGEALRPVVAARVVTATYAVAFSYCGADIAWEAYKLHKRGYVTEQGEPMGMPQLLVERTAFQAVASIGAPALIIHSTVDVSQRLFQRIGRFTKWGPSLMGLAVIPLLPMYLDEVVEHGIESLFHNYGPWAEKKKQE